MRKPRRTSTACPLRTTRSSGLDRAADSRFRPALQVMGRCAGLPPSTSHETWSAERHAPVAIRLSVRSCSIATGRPVSSSASALAPPLVGAAITAGAGWRAGYLVVPLAAVVAVGIAAVRTPAASDPPPDPEGRGTGERRPDRRAPLGFTSRWVDVLLAVSVEFCLVFWAADDLHSQHGLAPGPATAATGLLLLGMASGRAASAWALRLLPLADRLVALTTGVAAAGFALLWAVGDPAIAAAGLFLAGLGIALLYPVTLAEALAAWPANPSHAAARCALASGLAIGAAPCCSAPSPTSPGCGWRCCWSQRCSARSWPGPPPGWPRRRSPPPATRAGAAWRDHHRVTQGGEAPPCPTR